MTEEIRSTDPLVDGTKMTINPEIKYRRKRIISEQSYTRKPPKIAEFINACKFIAGESDKPFPLSTQHLNILALVRNGNTLPKNYVSVINNNIDTVIKAASLKPRQIKEMYNNKFVELKEEKVNDINTFNNRLEDLSKQKQYIDNPIQQKNTVKDSAVKININNIKKETNDMKESWRKQLSEEDLQQFRGYLHYRIGECECPTIASTMKSYFSSNISFYVAGRKTSCSRMLRAIMDEYPDVMGKLLYAKQVRDAKRAKTTKNTKTTKHIKNPRVTQPSAFVAQPKEVPQTISTVKITDKNDEFIDLVKALKSAGLSEITLKF